MSRRLIDADALILKGCHVMNDDGSRTIKAAVMEEDLDNAPTIDAVQVIRCKDCARNPNNGKARTICPCPMDRYMGPEGYCSKAESKEADG